MTDSERVIDDHPTRPSTITLEKWKEMKDQMEYLNDTTWPHHGMSLCALKIRASGLNEFWRDHISDKHGLGGRHGTACAAALRGSAEGHFLLCDGSNGQGRRMERRRMGGVLPRCVHVDFHQGCFVRRTQERPALGQRS